MRRKVKKVIDGDTFQTYRKVGGSNRVRLAGYNAAEKGTRAGRTATNKLRGLIGGRTVTVKPVGRSYGRTVANVYSRRKNVSKRLRNNNKIEEPKIGMYRRLSK
ncbi:MAG: hypothetical protein V1740_05335 [Candidatus Woesearchaeota archaeon]